MLLPGAVAFGLDGVLIGAADYRFLGRAAFGYLLAVLPIAAVVVAIPSLGLAGIWIGLVVWMILRAVVNARRAAQILPPAVMSAPAATGGPRARAEIPMVHKHVPPGDDPLFDELLPPFTGRLNVNPIPKNRMPDNESTANDVYRIIHEELMLDGSSRLNMATFVSTWMEPEAERLMAETFDKNMIDKDEYPQTAEIERRCVNMVANLFNAPMEGGAVGVSTIGSSEAVMLAGLAMKWRWRARRASAALSTDRPNMVLGSNVQVVWEKFCRYWDVEPRYVPMENGRYVITADDALARCDENTIGVIAILGTTYTGEFEPIEEIHDALVAYNEEHGLRHRAAHRRGQWRLRRPVPAPRPEVGLPAPPGEVDQRVRPQVRARLSRRSDSSSGAARRICPRTWCST